MKRIITTLSQKWPEYLLEILVITFGVLGAFALNSWNEGKEKQKEELKILIELHGDLKQNLDEIEHDLEGHKSGMSVTDNFRNYLSGKKPINDSLGLFLLGTAHDRQFYSKTSAFENLKSHGLAILSNDSLRTQITSLFELSYLRLEERGHIKENKFDLKGLMTPFIYRHCRVGTIQTGEIEANTIEDGQPSIPLYETEIKDVKALLADEELALAIGYNIDQRMAKIGIHLTCVERTTMVIQNIETEIARLSE